MFGFSTADWIFIGFILVVIYLCVIVSALIQKKKGSDS
jgi:preprotein translocase subunit SecG